MFKEIKASFEVSSKNLHYHYLFVIERKESGAFKYGDHSCHLLNLYDLDKNKEWLRDDYYDTRYDHLTTEKEKWLKFWTNYIKENWRDVSEIKVIDYEEKEVEEND